jgi:hypothetical protein
MWTGKGRSCGQKCVMMRFIILNIITTTKSKRIRQAGTVGHVEENRNACTSYEKS